MSLGYHTGSGNQTHVPVTPWYVTSWINKIYLVHGYMYIFSLLILYVFYLPVRYEQDPQGGKVTSGSNVTCMVYSLKVTSTGSKKTTMPLEPDSPITQPGGTEDIYR